MIYLLTAVGLTPGGSSTVHIYTKTIHRTTQYNWIPGVFENKMLRRIFGTKRDEVTGEWRKLHNEELNDLYCSPSIVRMIKLRRMGWAEHVARMGRGEAYTGFFLVGKPEGKRPLGRPRRRWEDNIKMDLQEVGCGGTDWIDLAQDRNRWRAVVNEIMNLRVA